MRRCTWLLALVFFAAACSGGSASDEQAAEDAPELQAAEDGQEPSEPEATADAALSSEEDARFAQLRERMVVAQIEERGIVDSEVLRAMRAVPRHLFVPDRYLDQAYADHPLPIGFGQTISQPFIVAFMTAVLELDPGAAVLEVGTGSGYQAAVLAEMGMDVYTMEIIPELAEEATSRLQSLGYTNVAVRAADGYLGWPEHAPFDAIMVTAAPDHVPQPLVRQLKLGGRMVVPVGPVGAFQTLWRFTTDESGELLAQNLGPVRFVPLTRSQE